MSGLDAVQAACRSRLSRQTHSSGCRGRASGWLGGQNKGALVLYGHGLGAIVLVEHAAGSGQSPDGVAEPAEGRARGHDRPRVATALGTVLLFDKGGVSFVLAGSMPPAAAETAARSIAG